MRNARTIKYSAPCGIPIMVRMVRNVTASTLAVLLVLAIALPSMVAATGERVRLVSDEGEPVPFTITSSVFDGVPVIGLGMKELGQWFECNGVGFWEDNGGSGRWGIGLEGGCTRGSTYGDQDLNVSVTVPGCAELHGHFGNVDEEETRPFSVSMATGSNDVWAGCGPVTELCFDTVGTDDDPTCVPFGLGLPPEAADSATDAGSCVVGGGDSGIAVTGEVVKRTRNVTVYHYGSVAYYRATFHVPTSTGRWWGYLVKSGTLAYPHHSDHVHSGEVSGPDGVGAVDSPPMGSLRTGAVLLTPGSTVTVLWKISGERQTVNEFNGGITAAANEALVTPDGTVAGIGIVKEGGTSWPNVTAYAGAAQVGTGPGSYAQQVGGITDPTACAWYWGTKTKPVTDAGKTDPIGPVPTEPPPEPVPSPVVYYGPAIPPAGCTGTEVCIPEAAPPVDQVCEGEFDWNDPATWGDPAACATVFVLVAIYEGVEGLLGVLNDIAALLTSLLVPPEGMWSDALAEIGDVWSGSELDEWSDALAGLVPDDPGSAGCQGPPVGPFELIDDAPGSYGSFEVPEMYPFSSCGDLAAPAAMVKGVLSVGVAMGGAWRMWDMLAGSFGAYRGGGRHMSDREWL